MANKRPIQTYYGHSARSRLNAYLYDACGRAASVQGAVLAATRHILAGEWKRCDIYDSRTGRLAYTVALNRRVVTVHRYTRSR